MEKMTIHRALSELKLIDAKIEKQIGEIVPVGFYQKGKLIYNHITEVEFAAAAQSRFDSVTALIARKTAIKSAIVQANGVTKVSVAGKQMTIADAINAKAVVKFKKALIEKLKAGHRAALADLNKQNAIVEANVQRILEATFGKENVKVSESDMEAVRKPYMSANEFHLFDPLKVLAIVDEMEKDVSDFEAEVDAVLSEINAVTIIEI